MIRTSIAFRPEDLAYLKAISKYQGMSVSGVLGQIIEPFRLFTLPRD